MATLCSFLDPDPMQALSIAFNRMPPRLEASHRFPSLPSFTFVLLVWVQSLAMLLTQLWTSTVLRRVERRHDQFHE